MIEPQIQYFDRIQLQNTIIEVGKPLRVYGGSQPGIYPVIEIQLYNKTLLVYCKVGKRVIPFNDDEIIGR